MRHDNTTVTRFRGAKVRALLAYLAIEPDRPHSRSVLAGLLWPDLPEADALRNLTQALVRLRAALSDGADPVQASRTEVQWRAGTAEIDAAEFIRLAGSAEPADLERAAALYQGELLAGFSLPGCEAFEEWLLLRREGLHEQALNVLHLLAERYLADGRAAEAAAAAARQLALDPWREGAYRQLMRAHAASGDRAAALVVYARCVEVLRDELGVPPDDETVQLAERIRAGDPALSAARDARARRPERTHSLPAPLTPLIGREEELARLIAMPESGARLVTLLGAGGAGKTRLALEAAWALRPRFGDGVWWVSLAGVQPGDDPALQRAAILGEITTALGLRPGNHQAPLNALMEYLAGQVALLVLDNCEHVPEAAPIARRLLEAAPGLRLLATSREPLGIAGEVLLRLGGLALPADGAADPSGHAAVRLFLDHARRRSPGWGEGTDDLAGAVRLCHLLGGMPLAIELAAHWVDHYTPDEIGDALKADLDFLAARTRDLPDRHRSLRAVFDYSWRLLAEGEQRSLARLAVFRGSFDRDAARVVAETTTATLVRLVDTSLLRQDGPGRYSLHELLRQFAAERLVTGLEAVSLSARHADYYLALAEQAAPELIGLDRAAWLPRLEAEHDNLRAALAWARTQPQPDVELRLAGALGRFWLLRGYASEGREWVERALARPGASDAPLRVRARLYEAGGMLMDAQGDQARGDQLFEQSIALYREAGDQRGEVDALILLAGSAYNNGKLGRAAAIWEACADLARTLDYSNALIRSLGNLGAALYYMGDLERAAAYQEEALAISRREGRVDLIAVHLTNLGSIARRMGDPQRAEALLKEALELKLGLNEPRQIAVTLERMAAVAAAEGWMERAARLLGAAHHVRVRLAQVASTPEHDETEETAADVRRALGDATWIALFEEGAALTLDEAAAYALREESAPSAGG